MGGGDRLHFNTTINQRKLQPPKSNSQTKKKNSVPGDHPFAQLSGTDNIIAFTTQRYPPSAPLVVRGPGAGAEVTAAGAFGDILKLIRGG
jgi:aspartokinase/homoserine dehydrogenase 1